MKSTHLIIATAVVMALCLLGGTLAADLHPVNDQVTASADQTVKDFNSDQLLTDSDNQENGQDHFAHCWGTRRR